MTHPIDRARSAALHAVRLGSQLRSVMVCRETLTLLTQPDPRVTALVEAVKRFVVRPGARGSTLGELEAALAPFLKENQDAQV